MEWLEPTPDELRERTGEVPTNFLPGETSRHALLRERTKEAHGSLDQFTIRSGFFDTRGAYASYLNGLGLFHEAYETAAASLDSHGWRAAWKIDKHAGWIAQELASLGRSESARRLSGDLPNIQLGSTAQLLGSLYVLAGSTLGARMLHKLTVERSIPLKGGSSYMLAVGQSLRWQDFLSFLESAPIEGDERGMLDGALETFRAVRESLEAVR